MSIHKVSPINELQEGERPKLIIKEENSIHDIVINNVLKLSDKTNVFHYNTNKLIPPIAFIGGRDIRCVGDTCRMFFKIRIPHRKPDYYFWDGIVQGDLNELDELDDNTIFSKEFLETNKKLQKIGIMHPNNDFGLATGKTNYRIVLIEKVPLK